MREYDVNGSMTDFHPVRSGSNPDVRSDWIKNKNFLPSIQTYIMLLLEIALY